MRTYYNELYVPIPSEMKNRYIIGMSGIVTSYDIVHHFTVYGIPADGSSEETGELLYAWGPVYLKLFDLVMRPMFCMGLNI